MEMNEIQLIVLLSLVIAIGIQIALRDLKGGGSDEEIRQHGQ